MLNFWKLNFLHWIDFSENDLYYMQEYRFLTVFLYFSPESTVYELQYITMCLIILRWRFTGNRKQTLRSNNYSYFIHEFIHERPC